MFGEVVEDRTGFLDDVGRLETTYPDKPVTQVAIDIDSRDLTVSKTN